MNQNKTNINFDEEWEFIMQRGIIKVRNLVEGIADAHISQNDYMMLYSKVYDMCFPNVNYSQELYDRYKKFIEDYIEYTVLPCLIEKQDEFMLRELVKRWSNHKVMLRYFRNFFNYLDRYFVDQNYLCTIKEVGMVCFRDMVYRKLNGRVVETVISLINQEREGVKIDGTLVKNVVDILLEVRQIGGYWSDMVYDVIQTDFTNYYENDFEAALLEDTIAYYSRQASKWILEDSCTDYMVKVEECLKREKDMVKHYLPCDTEVKLLEKLEHELLFVYATQLLENEHSGCRALLRDDKIEDLSRMFRLFRKIHQYVVTIATIFKQHVIEEGTSIFNQAEEDVNGMVLIDNFARKVIKLYDKYRDYVIGDCFSHHPLFYTTLHEAFKVFCNNDNSGSLIAESFTKFYDNILRNFGEKISDETIEESLEKVMKLLDYVSDKDIFAEFCRKNLARRLLFGKSSNDEYERSFLSKLKQQYGVSFTSKMEGMLKDFTLSRETQVSFEEYLANNNNPRGGIDLNVTILDVGIWPRYKSFDLNLPAEMEGMGNDLTLSREYLANINNPLGGIDLSVTILNAGIWPSYKSFDLNLPIELVKCVEVFHDFYSTYTKKRKLTWIYSLGTCNINGKFEQKNIELIVTTYQACSLLLFNDSYKLSYEEIKTQLNLPSDDVVRLLHSLSCAKYKILIKEPNTKTISPTDVFEFNAKFFDKMRRIKIPLAPMSKEKEKKKIIEDLDKDRRYIIDAALVRIMKSRKVMTFQELITECIEQLGQTLFKPEVQIVKKRIEELMSRDYFERDKNDPKLVNYVA